ncbi:MAG: sulfotransferase family 2 domain-containing protein [Thiotrichaceae bacterium]|nr:sulfotransferase family 2 domain-containing protein [Thiotrichaceae bacterium]
MSKPGQLLAFIHVEKAAGTSFIHILRHNYFMKYIDARPYHRESRGLFSASDLSVARKVVPGLSCIAGHSIKPFSDIGAVVPDIQYITILRDPVKRYVSQYQYWVERMDKKLSFEEFLDTEEVRNFQTKKFDASGDIEKAKKVLQKKIMLVGFVDEFDEFLVLLRDKLRPLVFDPQYKQQNLAKNKVKISGLFEKYKDKIKENNALDIELYNYARDVIYPESIKNYAGNFYEDVEQFKALNAVANIPMYKRYIDYIMRKTYIEPVTNLIRLSHGIEAKGSY